MKGQNWLRKMGVCNNGEELSVLIATRNFFSNAITISCSKKTLYHAFTSVFGILCEWLCECTCAYC
jgi:hypothetical protein